MAKILATRRAEAYARPNTLGSDVRNSAAYLLTPGRFTPGPLAPDAERLGHYRAEQARQRLIETGKILAVPGAMLTGEMLPVALTVRAMLGMRAASSINTSLNPDAEVLAVDAYRGYQDITSPFSPPIVSPIITNVTNAVTKAVSAILPSAAAASKPKNTPTI
ncbi:MAG: hypothetical protein SFW65_04740 [Alphaproteobacteria bacterium]|nr:hypothetical protein [Alphaproteobacteria bacterium]